jgi:hypothetical protein
MVGSIGGGQVTRLAEAGLTLTNLVVGFSPTDLALAEPGEIGLQARSSVVEHHLDMVVVGGSIPLAPTKHRHCAVRVAKPGDQCLFIAWRMTPSTLNSWA